MFLFTHGDAQYSAELILPNQVRIARTVGTCVAHPEQSVTTYHDLTFPETVYNVCMNVSENTVDIQLANDHEDSYSFGEIEGFFTGENGEPVIYYTTSDSLFKDDKTYEPVCCGNDPVNHPNHYKTSSGLEAIDVIDAFTEDLKGYECTYTSQVLKYTLRWKHKNGLEDLEKANWYLTRLINKLKEANK